MLTHCFAVTIAPKRLWIRQGSRLIRNTAEIIEEIEQTEQMANSGNTGNENMEQVMNEVAQLRRQMAEMMTLMNQQAELNRRQFERLSGQTNMQSRQTNLPTTHEQNRQTQNTPVPDGDDMFEDIDDYLRQRTENPPKPETKDSRVDELSQKLDKMALAMQNKGESSDLDLESLLINDEMPTRFKMPDLTKFDGTGDPKMHVKQYAITMGTAGLGKTQIVKLFMLSLQGAALAWYHDLDKTTQENWNSLVGQFVKQYDYNTYLEVTLRDLEMTRQKQGETFVDYVNRWRGKAARMKIRPEERDQVRMVVKGALPALSNKMQYIVLKNFRDVLEMGTQIEGVEADSCKNFSKRTDSQNAGLGFRQEKGHIGGMEIHAVKNQKFSNLGKPMSKILDKLQEKGLLQPLQPKSHPGPPPPHVDKNLYCKFHQVIGHSTDDCTRLRHEIQNLIDAGIITDPEASRSSFKSVLMIGSSMTEKEVMASFKSCNNEKPNASEEEVKRGKATLADHRCCAHDEQIGKMAADIEILKKQLTDLTSAFIKLFGQTKIEQETRLGPGLGSDQKNGGDSESMKIQGRRFSNLGEPMSKILENLKVKGLLQPLPLQQREPPPHLDKSKYCYFHQKVGHTTDDCTRLRHEIQDLIDASKIVDPEKTRSPKGPSPRDIPSPQSILIRKERTNRGYNTPNSGRK